MRAAGVDTARAARRRRGVRRAARLRAGALQAAAADPASGSRGGNVALVVLIDYGFFNLKVGAAAKAAGVPVLYFVTPQVWASRAGRMKSMARVITKAAVILPFEEELLRAQRRRGHVRRPSAARPRARDARIARRPGGGSAFPPEREVLALFPGSRAGEIKRLLADFLAVARELERRRPGLARGRQRRAVGAARSGASCPISWCGPRASTFSARPTSRSARAARRRSRRPSRAARARSCTAPARVDYAIAKRIVKIPYIGLLNIVAGREVAPRVRAGRVRADARGRRAHAAVRSAAPPSAVAMLDGPRAECARSSASRARPRASPRWRRRWRGERAGPREGVAGAGRAGRGGLARAPPAADRPVLVGLLARSWRIRVRNAGGLAAPARRARSRGCSRSGTATLLPVAWQAQQRGRSRCWSASIATAN